MSFQDIEGYGGGGGYNNNRNGAGRSSFGSRPSAEPDFNSLNANVSGDIEQLAVGITQVEKMVPLLGTAKDTIDLREDLRNHVAQSRNLVHRIQSDLKEMISHEHHFDETEKARRKRITQKLTKDFQTWLSKFHTATKRSAELERSVPPPKAPSSQRSTFANPFASEPREDEEKVALLARERSAQFMQIENDRDFNEAVIEEREQGIQEIESAMREVNEIFKDLSTIVYEQGQMIENIESFVSSAVVNTTIGVDEIKKAEEHQTSANTKSYCIVGIVVLIVIAAILVILFTTHPWSKKSSSGSGSA
eukprot:TRINITY_DN7064_c0_g1_i1.p1 TRINITY_DN7064_c0_g1~~TRINITY_DN7064_c0_g1_i1.p1  ORF type:complete len:306 (-),score=101.83 TRINITY_DN7064_c0_g1_i1:178-1095(-)